MFKRVVQVLIAVFLLAVVIVPNTLISSHAPVLIAGDDLGGGSGG